MKVGLISEIFKPLTDRPRVIKFDLLFNKTIIMLRSSNICITIINEGIGIYRYICKYRYFQSVKLTLFESFSSLTSRFDIFVNV